MKDNNNLLTVNLWSGGEYFQNTSFNSQNKLIVSNKFSTLGEYSTKYIQPSPANWGSFSTHLDGALVNKKYKLSLDIYNPDNEYYLQLLINNNQLVRVTIPKLDKCQNISLTINTPSTAFEYVYLQFFNNADNSKIFVDNVNFIEVVQ